MAITKDQKTEILDDLKKKFKDAKGVVFASYSGLSVVDAQTLRRGLREANVDYKVAKKTLIKLAAKDAGYDLPAEAVEGPTGVAFGYDDEIVAAQRMAKYAKLFEGVVLTGGVMEGKVINAAVVNQLASIPSRDELLAKFLGSAMRPLTGFVGIGNALVGGFVRVVNAYQEQRVESGDALAPTEATPVEEAKAEEEAPTEETKVEDAAPAEETPGENA